MNSNEHYANPFPTNVSIFPLSLALTCCFSALPFRRLSISISLFHSLLLASLWKIHCIKTLDVNLLEEIEREEEEGAECVCVWI